MGGTRYKGTGSQSGGAGSPVFGSGLDDRPVLSRGNAIGLLQAIVSLAADAGTAGTACTGYMQVYRVLVERQQSRFKHAMRDF
jgi:hypothetical protein